MAVRRLGRVVGYAGPRVHQLFGRTLRALDEALRVLDELCVCARCDHTGESKFVSPVRSGRTSVAWLTPKGGTIVVCSWVMCDCWMTVLCAR